MKNITDQPRQWPLRSERMAARNIPFTPLRHHAISMELAAHLDGQYVEMHILTDKGKSITIVCGKNSILSIQKHIEQISCACPEISTWRSARDDGNLRGNDRRSYEAAMWEGWPAYHS